MPPRILIFVLCALGALDCLAGQIDSSTYFLLQRGMSESEILVRAGKPDLKTESAEEFVEQVTGRRVTDASGVVRFDTTTVRSAPFFSTWHYVPDRTEHDPHITVITFRAGKVWEIQRTKVFSRAGLPAPEPPAAEPRPVQTDEGLTRARLERTLDAAERYAETRARIKARAESDFDGPASGTRRKVYRRVGADGTVYYGDAPPGPSIEFVDVE